MQKVHLLLGGNLGDRIAFLEKAYVEIEKKVGKVVSQSKYYETAPWGFEHNSKFLNQVLVVESRLPMDELLKITQLIEKRLGRQQKTQGVYEGRTMDIDILFCEKTIVDTPVLQIPHPRLHQRRFTLVPLNEIDPNFEHPILKKTIRNLLDICEDDGEVFALEASSCLGKAS